LETTAYAFVSWVGVKLIVITLAYEDIGVLVHDFPHITVWTLTFYGILILIGLLDGFCTSQ